MFKKLIYEGRIHSVYYRNKLIDGDFEQEIITDGTSIGSMVGVTACYIGRATKVVAKNIALYYISKVKQKTLNISSLKTQIEMDADSLIMNHKYLQYDKYRQCVKNQVLKELYIHNRLDR